MAERYGRAREDERHESALIDCDAFGGRVDDAYMRLIDREFRDMRVLRDADGSILSCIRWFEDAQYFDGRRVSMAGVRGVATPHERRGLRAGRQAMQCGVREMHDAGIAISTLYPATERFYRSLGYGLAGTNNTITVFVHPMEVRPDHSDGLRTRRMTTDDADALVDCNRRAARLRHGWMERGEWWIRASLLPRLQSSAAGAFVVEDSAGLVEAYVTFTQHRDHAVEAYRLHCEHVAFTTTASAVRIITLFSSARFQVDRVTFTGSHDDALLAFFNVENCRVRNNAVWMTRMLNPVLAISQRGFNPAIDAEVHLRLRDTLITQNTGSCVLRVRDGAGTLEPGGTGAVELDIADFASIYTGHRSARELAWLRGVTGDEASLHALDACFAGEPPAMGDSF